MTASREVSRSLALSHARSLREEEEGETISGEISVHSILVARNFSGSCCIKLVLKHYFDAFVLALYLSFFFLIFFQAYQQSLTPAAPAPTLCPTPAMNET